MSTQTIDLSKFVAAERGRYLINRDFVRKGWRYATDGRICVRLPAEGEPDTEGLFPPAEELFAEPTPAWRPWPEPQREDAEDQCPTCAGKGAMGELCNQCKGTGIHECSHCHHEGDCPLCAGRGRFGPDCVDCRGCGERVWPSLQVIGDRYVAVKYDDLVRTLGAVEYANLPGEGKPVRFRFPGGEGVLMPKRKPTDIYANADQRGSESR